MRRNITLTTRGGTVHEVVSHKLDEDASMQDVVASLGETMGESKALAFHLANGNMVILPVESIDHLSVEAW